jgi:hypothetical protein
MGMEASLWVKRLSFEAINNWYALAGGFSGLCFLAYMGWMAYHANKKNHNEQLILRDLAEIKGLLRRK